MQAVAVVVAVAVTGRRSSRPSPRPSAFDTRRCPRRRDSPDSQFRRVPWCSLPYTTGRDCDRQSGGVGEGGVGLGLGLCQPSSSCRSLYLRRARRLYGPCVGRSASFNHVDHPRADLYFRRQPARRDFASARSSIFCLRGPVLYMAGLVTSSASKLVVLHVFTPKRRRTAPLSSHPALPGPGA